MTDLSPSDAALLQQIAQPDVAGVPGALGVVALDTLLSAGLVDFGFIPPSDLSPPTYADAWVSPTEAGWAWLAENL
jgi:hypothetical protein